MLRPGISGQLYVRGICSREKGYPAIAGDHGTVQAATVHVCHKVHSVADRIVSIHQPWMRPIVRRKAKTTTDLESNSM